MTTPYVAPYGGLLTKTLDEEKEREAKLQSQQINVAVNNLTETLRPEAIMVRGVDSLSSEDIKAFVDYYLNFETRATQTDDGSEIVDYMPKPIDDQITFRIQWINDAAVNIVFQSHEHAYKALKSISITAANPNMSSPAPQESTELTQEHVADIIQERETKPYSPTIQFRHKQNLLNRLAIADQTAPEDEEEKMVEDDSAVVLYARQSFQSDRKVKNASVYSRYYLLHGEPERRPRYNQNTRQRGGARSREDRHGSDHRGADEEEDLFADRLKSSTNASSGRSSASGRSGAPRRSRSRHHRGSNEEEDLFASKLRMRERSPTRNRSRSPMRD